MSKNLFSIHNCQKECVFGTTECSFCKKIICVSCHGETVGDRYVVFDMLIDMLLSAQVNSFYPVAC